MEGSDIDVIHVSVGVIAIALTILALEIMRIDKEARQNRRRVMWVKGMLRNRNEEGTFNVLNLIFRLMPQLLSDDWQKKTFCE